MAADRDDVALTYRIYRGWQTDTPIATVTRDSVPYANETFTVRDTSPPTGSPTYYRVLVTDPAGNQVMSVRSASVTVRASASRVQQGEPVVLTARVAGGHHGTLQGMRPEGPQPFPRPFGVWQLLDCTTGLVLLASRKGHVPAP